MTPTTIVPGPYLTGPYAPTTAEVDVADLVVTGELPAELDGTYLRNGPNPRFSPIGSFLYPIDGDGMLHRVELSGGRARYTNRFVRTPMVVAEEAAGHAIWPGLMTPWRPGPDEVGAALAGTLRAMPNVNVVRHGGRLLALAESHQPFRMDPELRTLAAETFGGVLPGGICAHPRIDPATGEMIAFTYHLGAPFLTWTVIRADGTAAAPRVVEGLEQPAMIHDMALTERYVVLVVAPLFFDLAAARNGGSMLAWRPEAGTRIALIPRDGGPVRWCADTAFWSWHTVNAHDAGGTVVLDHVEWARPDGIVPGPDTAPRLARAVVDPAAGSVRREVLDDLDVEFPRVDDRLLGRAHPVAAFAAKSGRATLHPDVRDALAWYANGTMVRWEPADEAVGEPVFAPGPDGGWWVALTTRFGTGESTMVVIPAADPASGPVATVRMPVRVPLGLHGTWLPTE